jgi:hypothetical protein
MPFTLDEIQGPFWAKESSQSSGRDPLAIQNSSVVIYTRMMTGITNVTNRLRYIGFFCWCFDKYLKVNSGKYSFSDQFRHMRRAELLMAYLMVELFPDELGVSGTNLARNSFGDLVDLSIGADIDRKSNSNKMYWQYPQGIFGQYFSGVMREFGLIRHPDVGVNLYSLTDKGGELASLFEFAIGSEASQKFWYAVEQGNIPRENLANLIPFSLSHIKPGSAENIFYENMLMDQDSVIGDKSYHRRETILLILKFVEHREESIRQLPLRFLANNCYSALEQQGQNSDARSFWALYELTEIFHLSLEHFHACLLWSIKSGPEILQEAISSLISLAGVAWGKWNINFESKILSDLIDLPAFLDQNAHELCNQMTAEMNNRNYGEVLKYALLSMLKVMGDIAPHKDKFYALARQAEYHFDRPGNLFELLNRVVNDHLGRSISSFYDKNFNLVINLHTYSSYAKSRIGLGQAHNYLIEEDMIWAVRDTSPNRTSPRLQNTVQFMLDVGWLNRYEEKGYISISGKDQLKKYGF